MASSKLRQYFSLAIVLFIAHGIEEYFTRFYEADAVFYFATRFVSVSPKNLFIVLQLIFWTLLILFLRYMNRKSLGLTLAYLIGLLMLFEVTHVFLAISSWSYYPGLLTSLLLLVLLVPFVRELYKVRMEFHG